MTTREHKHESLLSAQKPQRKHASWASGVTPGATPDRARDRSSFEDAVSAALRGLHLPAPSIVRTRDATGLRIAAKTWPVRAGTYWTPRPGVDWLFSSTELEKIRRLEKIRSLEKIVLLNDATLGKLMNLMSSASFLYFSGHGASGSVAVEVVKNLAVLASHSLRLNPPEPAPRPSRTSTASEAELETEIACLESEIRAIVRSTTERTKKAIDAIRERRARWEGPRGSDR
jgi:hypothetical protein